MWNNFLTKIVKYCSFVAMWNEINPHTPAGVFHMAKPYFTHEVHFTNPVRDLFRWKKSIAIAMLFFLAPPNVVTRFWTLNQVTNFEPYGSRRKALRRFSPVPPVGRSRMAVLFKVRRGKEPRKKQIAFAICLFLGSPYWTWTSDSLL